MALLDQLRQMYGMQDDESRIQAMLSAQPPELEPPPLSPDVVAATSSDMTQPGAAQPGGSPDVMSFIKELEQKGAFEPKAASKPKGMSAAQVTTKTEEGGVPADVRAQGVAVRGQAEMDDAAILRDRAAAEAEALEQRAIKLRQDAEVEAMDRQKAEEENAKRQERLRSQQMELANQADEPINPRRYIENMSFLGKASALLSAGIYGYLGGRGQPPVVETIMKMTQEDTAAQLADRQANAARRNSLIEQYERQYGDTTLVAKRLDADKLHTLAKQADAEAKQAKSAELKAQAEDIGKKLRNRVGVLHQEIQEATYGKPVETTTTYKPTVGKGAGDPAALLKKAAELNKTLAESGYPPEQRAAMLKAAGLPSAQGTTMGEQKFAADQAESAAKRTELSPEEEKDLRNRTDGLAEQVQGLRELDTAVGFVRNEKGEVVAADDKALDGSIKPKTDQFSNSVLRGLPFKIGTPLAEFSETREGEGVKKVKRLADKIVFGQAKAEGQGAMSDGDRATYRARLPVTEAETLKSASAEVWRARRQQYENLVGQYGKEAVDAMLRKRGVDPTEVGGGSTTRAVTDRITR